MEQVGSFFIIRLVVCLSHVREGSMAPSPTRSPSPSPSPSYAHPGVVVVRGDGAPAPPAHGGGAGGGGASSKSSSLEEVVLSESSYLKGLSEIIERDFFPSLKANRARSQLLSAQRSHDIPAAIAASALLADIRDGVLPSNGLQDGDAPLTTPSGRPLSLDEFARKYTSEDNASYAKLAAVEAARRRAKRKWTHRDSGATGDARETNAFALPPPPPPRKTLALTAGPGATAAAATKTATTKAPARVAAASTRFPVDEGHALGWAPSSVASSAATTPSTSQAWSPDVDQPRTFGMFQERERERVSKVAGVCRVAQSISGAVGARRGLWVVVFDGRAGDRDGVRDRVRRATHQRVRRAVCGSTSRIRPTGRAGTAAGWK